MRVFVSHGYDPNELWVRDLVVPVLEALGAEVLTGERASGGEIERVVRHRIRNSDGLIAFLQRRQVREDGKSWETSTYVENEIAAAYALEKPIIRFVERGVRDAGGMAQRHQSLEFVLAERDQLLVELAKQVQAWVEGTVSIRLAPCALEEELNTMGPGRLPHCDFTIKHQGYPELQGQVPITAVGGGLYVRLVGFRPGRFLDLTIQTASKTWWCQGVLHTFPSVTVNLK